MKRRLLNTSGTSLTVEVQVLHRIQGRSASLSRQCCHVVKNVVLLLRFEPGQRSQALVHGVQEEGVDEGPPGLELKIPKYSKLIFLFVKYFSSYLHSSPINQLKYTYCVIKYVGTNVGVLCHVYCRTSRLLRSMSSSLQLIIIKRQVL